MCVDFRFSSAADSRPAVFGMNERPMPRSETALLAASAHASWRDLIDREPMETPWSVPGGEPMAVSDYETIWKRYTARESKLCILLSDPSLPDTPPLHTPPPARSQGWAATAPTNQRDSSDFG